MKSLRANNLGVEFDSKWLFRGFNFELNAGRCVALVGPSGCGKSILLKSLALLHQSDEGTVEFDGQAVQSHEVPAFRSQVMYVPQRTADTDGAVEDYFKEPFRLSVHHGKQWDANATLNQLREFGRGEEFLQKTQRDLSGGERQMIALIRSLSLEPACLLLDEPTSAMDVDNAAKAEAMILSWFGDGSVPRSYVWVTHDRAQAERVADEVVDLGQRQP